VAVFIQSDGNSLTSEWTVFVVWEMPHRHLGIASNGDRSTQS